MPGKIVDCNFVILCNMAIVQESDYIDNLLNATFAHNSFLPTAEHSVNTSTGYVILVPSNLMSPELRNMPNQAHISLSVNTRLNLIHSLTVSHLRLRSLQLLF